jgi:hypothetical protein
MAQESVDVSTIASGAGPITQYAVQNPAVTGVYVYSLATQIGVVAANTFLTMFNPVGSGKSVIFGAAYVSTLASGATSAIAPMRGYRISAAPTGGTVQANSDIAKFNTSYPNSVVEIRSANPTVTLQAALWNTPPTATSGAGGGQFVHLITVPPGSGAFLLKPGEGIAINTSVGSLNQVWNFSLVWEEL